MAAARSGRVRSDLSRPGGAQRPDAAIARADARVGPADHEAALRPHHGARSQSRDAAWMVPNGDGPRNHPLLKDLNLPPLGTAGPRRAARHEDAAVHRRRQRRHPRRSDRMACGNKFRAYDKATGKVVWEMELPAGTTGGPMTYMRRASSTSSCRSEERITARVGGAGAARGGAAEQIDLIQAEACSSSS